MTLHDNSVRCEQISAKAYSPNQVLEKFAGINADAVDNFMRFKELLPARGSVEEEYTHFVPAIMEIL